MCQPPTPRRSSTLLRKSNSVSGPPRRSPFLLLSHESFVDDVPDKDDAAKAGVGGGSPHVTGLPGAPSLPSTLRTVALYLSLTFLAERLAGDFLARRASAHPILENERNRAVLARHVGVDFVCLAACAVLAIANRADNREAFQRGLSFLRPPKGARGPMGEAGANERIYGYRPGAQRLLLVFFVYQVKNMYDTIYWGDGAAYVLHHIFAGSAAWVGLFPGCCHFYALFYFGFSEVSTAILCLLANFDHEHGVPGLDDLLPKTKVVLGTLFLITFVCARCVAWPCVTYHFTKDALAATRGKDPRADGRRGCIRWVIACAWGLSVIQLVFVAMIVQTARVEYAKEFARHAAS